MLKHYTFALLAIILSVNFNTCASTPVSSLSRLPIQNEGRLKPLDTFARNTLLTINEKSSIKNPKKILAINWLHKALIDPVSADKIPVFRLRNPAVLNALSIKANADHVYSPDEIIAAMRQNIELLREISQKKRDDRGLVEKQLFELYQKTLLYHEVTRSLSCLTKDMVVASPTLQKSLGLGNTSFSYFDITRMDKKFTHALDDLQAKKQADYSDDDIELSRILMSLAQRRSLDRHARQLTIIPPDPSHSKTSQEWQSPWELLDGRPLTIWQVKRLTELQHWLDMQEDQALDKFLNAIKAQTPDNQIPLELHYNKTDYFTNSLVFYILGFLLLLISWAAWTRPLQKASFVSIFIGCFLHGTGLLMRMFIMGRPPVSTLYESIIFVGFVGVFSCIWLEWVRKDGIGSLMASTLGAVLHFIAFSYAADGDTMGMLVAVLDSNFWLATHVVTITIGYGCAFVAGTLGHIYIACQIFKPQDKKRLADIFKNLIGLSIVAVFFTTLGTILGGIWADQSWGRFWGWDPKENGAMLIVLWLLMVIHLRLGGTAKALGFATGLALTNICVALAWFGVNLLNVGLHAYGFTENIATNLALFCGGETIIITIGYFIARRQRDSGSTKRLAA